MKFKGIIAAVLLVTSLCYGGDKAMEASGRQVLLEKIAGEWVTHCIYAATELGVAEQLEGGPLSIDALAKKTGTKTDLLYRLMGTLASNGIFEEREGKVFANNEASALLSPNHARSLYDITLFYKEVISSNWSELGNTLKTGTPAFELKQGMPVFAYFKENAAAGKRFNAGMRDKSASVIDSVLTSYDMGSVKELYDIGGGKGHFAFAALKKYPGLKATIFEVPKVVEAACAGVPEGLSKRVSFAEGDFFKEIPQGGDVYLLKSVIHDWNSDAAQKILKNCHDAMGSDARLLLVEMVLGPRNTEDYAKSMDMLMMTITGGRERTLGDFRELLATAGFALTEVYPTDTEFSVIEARKL